jgi:hypothetical protein
LRGLPIASADEAGTRRPAGLRVGGGDSQHPAAPPFLLADRSGVAEQPLAHDFVRKRIERGREKGYRKHMTACMREMGYEVADWTRAPKKQRGTASLAPANGRVAPPPVVESARTEEPATQTDPADGEAHSVVVLKSPAG